MQIDKRSVNLQAPGRSLLRYPNEPSEFEVQAYLYAALSALGFLVRGEVATHASKARFDLVVFRRVMHEGRCLRTDPVRIIEVKCGQRSSRRGTSCGDQIGGYYDRFGVPVDLVGGMSEAHRYMKSIGTFLDSADATGPFWTTPA